MYFLVLNWIFKNRLKILVFVYCTCFFFFLRMSVVITNNKTEYGCPL